MLSYSGKTACVVDGWHFVKVPWASSDAYRGPAVVRGRQLDGPNELRFVRDNEHWQSPPTTLRIPITANTLASVLPEGWRFQPAAVGIRSPGCYAFQIDGVRFTRLLVFEAAR